ncbi:protein FAM210B, mitochondrial [Lampris incognitus]|uniref:protein FAM210B, mitochondrial n=1 Tax=Lampris incognitus TaxID=2546036 RepID=UPI0024B4D1CA|nr:protein FAM210B, mitochondrial [Lampris incognitus]
MFFRRGLKLSAALDQAFKSTGFVQANGNRLKDLTWTLHKGCTSRFHREPSAPAGGLYSARSHGRDHEKGLIAVKARDSSCRFIIPDRAHFVRVATTSALNLPKCQRSVTDLKRDADRPLYQATWHQRGAAPETMDTVLFTGAARICAPNCSIKTTQTRASSTATAAAQKRGAHSSETRPGDKAEEQEFKDHSTTSSPSSSSSGEPEDRKLNKTQQLKKVFKEYGAVGVSFHVGISLMSLGMFYLLVSSGIDMAAVLCKLGFSEAVIQSKMAAGTSTFVLAYAVHKVFAPVRISITLVSVPLIVRYFRKTGLFKPPTPTP